MLYIIAIKLGRSLQKLIGNEELLTFGTSRKQGLKLHLIFFLNWIITVPQTTCYKDIVCLNFGLLEPHRGVDLRCKKITSGLYSLSHLFIPPKNCQIEPGNTMQKSLFMSTPIPILYAALFLVKNGRCL